MISRRYWRIKRIRRIKLPYTTVRFSGVLLRVLEFGIKEIIKAELNSLVVATLDIEEIKQ